MVFRLILHSSHHHQPEEIRVPVVSARENLMVNKGHLNLLAVWEPVLSLMVSDENIG